MGKKNVYYFKNHQESAAVHGVAESQTQLSDWTQCLPCCQNWQSSLPWVWHSLWLLGPASSCSQPLWAPPPLPKLCPFAEETVCSQGHSVQFSHSVVPDSLLPHGLQHAVLSIPVHHQSQSLLKLMSIESVMPSNYLILCCPFLLLPSIFPSIRVFSNESALRIRWPKVWSFSFSISPSNKYSRLISFLGWTGWISLQSKGVSRVFSNTTAQKHLYVVFDVLLCI